MKINKTILGTFRLAAIAGAGLFLASVGATQAQTTLTSWNFDNVALGINASPSPSTGLGTATALGMANSYNNTNSVSNPDVQALSGSSSGGTNCWRIRGFSTVTGSRGNGWSTNAPIASQGTKFSGSTAGFYKIKASFDVYATSDGEANLQVQYSTDGTNWVNANIVSAAAGVIATNTSSPYTVHGTYIQLASGWNNQVTVDLTGISGVDNDLNFAVRMVNASTGTDCVDTTGAIYNNTSGNWSFDNVTIQGQAIDVIANWNYDALGVQAAPYNNPAPTTGSGTSQSLGMINGYTNNDGTVGSSNWCDITAQAGSSTGPNSLSWRVRGGASAAGVTGSGWNSAAPVGTQGAEWDVDTSGYSNIVCGFDLYLTTQAPAKVAVEYTTDGWATTTNIASSFYFGTQPLYMHTNSSDPNMINGVYFFETLGQGWFNYCMVDLTGVPSAANNPLFGFRVINAATGVQCVAPNGGSYNNQSGNVRFGNVTVGGTAGTPAPIVAFDPNATVDNTFTNTYTDNPAWRTSIYAIYVNGVKLTNTAYNATAAGQITFDPTKSTLLQASGLLNISVLAHGFGSARVAQPLAAGVATKLAVTSPVAGPSASTGTLISNPFFLVSDKYNNGTTNPYPNVTITATVGGIGGWTLGGDTVQTSSNGVIDFTNLTATLIGSTPVSNAYITFSVVGYGSTFATNSTNFNIGASPAPFTPGNLAVLQIDSQSNNTTFSIVEVKPSSALQTTPVNIVPVSATGTNALRLAPSATTGRLALSDDGTLVAFSAFADGSAATPDETLNLNRAAAAMNSSGVLTNVGTYASLSLNGSQARAACVVTNSGNGRAWIVVDKGGLYQGDFGANVSDPNLNNFNNVVVKTFGGNPWVETQKAVAGLSIPVVYQLGLDQNNGLYDVTFANNLTTDGSASDFYLISTNGGVTYDVLYICDQVSATNGIINKYSFVGGIWTANGTFTNKTGIDGMCAITNGNGGVSLFFTTGGGGSPNNSIVRVTDANGWNQNISITSSNVLYTAAGGVSLKGLTFTPQTTSNAVQLLPPPILTAQNAASVGSTFSVTNTPSDVAWHGAITGITVNGTPLPPAAYDVTQANKIVFTPTNSVLLQSAGPRTIAVTATGYSSSAVVQNINGVARPTLGGVTISAGASRFTFTSTPGLHFSVQGSTNITAPIATWPVVGAATETPAGSGNYQFTDPAQATNSALYYLIRQP